MICTYDLMQAMYLLSCYLIEWTVYKRNNYNETSSEFKYESIIAIEMSVKITYLIDSIN